MKLTQLSNGTWIRPGRVLQIESTPTSSIVTTRDSVQTCPAADAAAAKVWSDELAKAVNDPKAKK